ncbi:MAG: hypothetical protein P4L35_11570 [Ignavibacteriaceae bacterium]|nr:hypothetical protein [Ignavibacteriaceae bacterium]
MPDSNGSDVRVLLSALLSNKKIKREFRSFARRLLYQKSKYEFARHVTSTDIVSSVSLKLLADDIHWDPDKNTLISFFYSRIRTEVSNLIKKEKKFIPIPISVFEIDNDEDEETDDEIPLPDQYIIYPFEEKNIREEIDLVEFEKIAYGLFKDSPEEFCVLDEIFKGYKSNVIAKNLGIMEKDVYNIKKRILRVLKSWVARNRKKIEIEHDLIQTDNSKSLLTTCLETKPRYPNSGVCLN